MTLEQYKSQCEAINKESENFKGTEEEAMQFFENLAQKYAEVNEFNEKALNCKDIAEFKKLADSFGIKFSDENSAEELYSLIADSKKEIDVIKNYLNSRDMSDINGGFNITSIGNAVSGIKDSVSNISMTNINNWLSTLSSSAKAVGTAGKAVYTAAVSSLANNSAFTHAAVGLAGLGLGYLGHKVYSYFNKPKDPNSIGKIL